MDYFQHMKKLVLIIENDTLLQSYMGMCLQMEGFDTIHASNGAEALTKLASLTLRDWPTLAFVDVRMPVMDGPKFISELEKCDPLPLSQIVLVTAELAPPKVHFKNRACKILSKPYDMDEIISISRDHFKDFRQTSVTA